MIIPIKKKVADCIPIVLQQSATHENSITKNKLVPKPERLPAWSQVATVWPESDEAGLGNHPAVVSWNLAKSLNESHSSAFINGSTVNEMTENQFQPSIDFASKTTESTSGIQSNTEQRAGAAFVHEVFQSNDTHFKEASRKILMAEKFPWLQIDKT